MNRWVVIYEHRFGVDVLFIDAPGGEYVEEEDVVERQGSTPVSR
jgi:hypothetical protein